MSERPMYLRHLLTCEKCVMRLRHTWLIQVNYSSKTPLTL